MERTRDKSAYVIQAVVHALNLLEQFGDEADLSVNHIAHELKLTRNNAERLLMTLEVRGYVERSSHPERYQLGLKAMELGQNYLRQGGLLQRSGPILDRLMAQTGETVYLAVLKRTQIAYLATVQSNQPVRVVSRMGTRLPAYCTASGKAHLAFFPREVVERLFPEETLQGYTPRTHTSRESLFRELEEIARQGVSIDHEEYEADVHCVAAPVFDHTGQVAGALSLSGPAFRLTAERIEEELAPLIREACGELSRQLGYAGVKAD